MNNFIDIDELNATFNLLHDPHLVDEVWLRADVIDTKLLDTAFSIYMNAQGPSQVLKIKVIETGEGDALPVSFRKDTGFSITGAGYQNQGASSRDDGVVIFGRDNKQFEPDIKFDRHDPRISRCHFCINSDSKGYYLCDKGSKYGLSIKLQAGTPLKLQNEMMIDFGNNNLCVVKSINSFCDPGRSESGALCINIHGLKDFEALNAVEATGQSVITRKSSTKLLLNQQTFSQKVTPTLTLQFISGELEDETFVLNVNSSNEFLIGRHEQNSEKKAVSFYSKEISRMHGMLKHDTRIGWVLQDLQSRNGIWVLVNSYSNQQQKKAAWPVRIQDRMIFCVADLQFQCELAVTSKKLGILQRTATMLKT